MKLSVLRDIGWTEWDPIGLADIEGGWRDNDGANEYDAYLLQVAARLQRGEPEVILVDYLVRVETDHMGLSPGPTTRPRAVAAVDAIKAYVQSLT